MTDPVTRDSDLIHRTLVTCGLVVAIGLAIGLLYAARDLLPLIFGAILIAVVLNQIAGFIGKVSVEFFAASCKNFVSDCLYSDHRLCLDLCVRPIGERTGYPFDGSSRCIGH